MSDGFITLPAEILLPDATPEERQMIVARLGGNDQGAPVQANIPLIRHGNDLILIDNGSGSNFQSPAGKLAVNLSALGVDPAKITKVVFTHAHPDHSSATTTSDGKVLYPNAHYFVSRAEWDFWTDKNFEANMPRVLQGFAQGAQRDLFAVRDRLTLVKPGEEIVPAMLVVDTQAIRQVTSQSNSPATGTSSSQGTPAPMMSSSSSILHGISASIPMRRPRSKAGKCSWIGLRPRGCGCSAITGRIQASGMRSVAGADMRS